VAKPVRRVVTGINAQGRSCVLSDGDGTVTLGTKTSPVFLTELWKTTQAPAEDVSLNGADRDSDGWTDPVEGPIVIAPGPTGTIFRICEFPPQIEVPAEEWAAAFEAMGQPLAEGADPAMHATDTVDYTVILEGEIWAKLENGEVLLRPGDAIVQRGTNHAWENRGDVSCRFVAVLVGAHPRRSSG